MTRLAGPLEVEDAGEQIRTLAIDRRQEAGRARRDVGVGVDLPVRVGERDADRLAAVLEREDLLDAGQRRQCGGAVGPGLDDRARPGRGERAERAGVLGAEAHDLAPPDARARAAQPGGDEVVEVARCVCTGRCIAVGDGECRAERRRLVLEDGHVVARRDLGRVGRRLRGERVELGGREERAVLARCRDRHPVARQHVAPHRRGVGAGGEFAGVDRPLGSERRAGVVVVDELAAVGEARRALDDAGAERLRRDVGGADRAVRPKLRCVHVNTVPIALC